MVIFEICCCFVCQVLPESTSGVNKICDFDHLTLSRIAIVGGDEMCVSELFFLRFGGCQNPGKPK